MINIYLFITETMLATVSLRASRSLNISRRRITSLTKDNSRRSQKKHLSYEIVIPAMVSTTPRFCCLINCDSLAYSELSEWKKAQIASGKLCVGIRRIYYSS